MANTSMLHNPAPLAVITPLPDLPRSVLMLDLCYHGSLSSRPFHIIFLPKHVAGFCNGNAVAHYFSS